MEEKNTWAKSQSDIGWKSDLKILKKCCKYAYSIFSSGFTAGKSPVNFVRTTFIKSIKSWRFWNSYMRH